MYMYLKENKGYIPFARGGLKLEVPTDWSDMLIEGIVEINESEKAKLKVAAIYGAEPTSVLAGGRPKEDLPRVTKNQINEHFEKAHDVGLSVNYVLNAPTTLNREYTAEGKRSIRRYFEWLDSVGVDILTVSDTQIIEMVKENSFSFRICVSTNALIRSPQEARFFEELGADIITIDFMSNRDFKTIRAIRRAVKSELLVLANDPCLLHCPHREKHQLGFAIEAQLGTPYGDYCGEECARKRIEEPVEIIKSPWIRPEDTAWYEAVGVQWIKIAGRTKSTEWILRCAKAYADADFDGDIYAFVEKSRFYSSVWRVFCPEIGPFNGVYVDNKKLEGFIKPFFEEEIDCNRGCEGCRYCDKWARKAVRISEEGAKEHVAHLQRVRSGLVSLS